MNPAWKKGCPSPNPGGRPRLDPVLRKKIQEMSPELFERLKKLAMKADTDGASINAIKLLLGYAWGSPETLAREDDGATPERPQLTLEERKAIARMKLSTEQAADAVPASDDATKH